ncbi:unnamed protein product [Rhizoctonia solani]|uniref:Uncharacterized protein n=1 Tax=Rhizoctonia solani TaxID=456999 RepID=A0A8H2WY64_9AGAM|nr:unnamed protein product [Rhizoctonia solani]
MGEWPLQILGFDTWRAPRLPTRVMTLIRHPLTGRHQLPNILSLQPLPQRPHYALNHFDQILSLCVPMELCMPLLIEWPIKPIEVETWTLTPLIIALIPPNTSIIYSHEFLTTFNRIIDFLLRARLQVPQRAGQATEHRRPLPIEWYSTNSDTAKPPEAICPLSSPNTIFPPPLTLVSRTIASIGSIHLLPPPALGFPFPAGLREVLRLTAVQHLRIRANNILCQSEATGQRAPLLIDWYSEKMVDIVPPPKAIEPSPLVTFHLTGDHLHPTLSIQRTSQLLRALAPSSYTHTTFTPRFDHAAYHPPARLLIEWYAHPQVAQPLDDEVKISFPESPTFAPTSAIQLDHQSHPKTPPRIPTSFHRYANIRIEDLDAYPPEQRVSLCS